MKDFKTSIVLLKMFDDKHKFPIYFRINLSIDFLQVG